MVTDVPIELESLDKKYKKSKDIVGVGGDGGGSVSQYPYFEFSGIVAKRGV